MSEANRPMRLVFLGSGGFGLPTLERLAAAPAEYDIVQIVTQPDRPAGRHRRLQATDVGEWAATRGFPVLKPEDVNAPPVVAHLHSLNAEALVVIAFGQKLGRELLDGLFAINLHGSLLPRHRGAAPVNWAIISGDAESGVSVITLADRMDAGDILGQASTPIGPEDTAGELHDRLAALGPDLIETTLRRYREGTLEPIPQDESQATRAPKLHKADGMVDFTRPCASVRARVHGLNPWPGCAVVLGDHVYKLGLVRENESVQADAVPGSYLGAGLIACGDGAIEVQRIQAPGRRMMDFNDFIRGHHDFSEGRIFEPWTPPHAPA